MSAQMDREEMMMMMETRRKKENSSMVHDYNEMAMHGRLFNSKLEMALFAGLVLLLSAAREGGRENEHDKI